MTSHVSIIVLNLNQAEYTRDCLRSLQRVDFPCFQILVVDNGSSDDSLRQVAREFPNVDFIWLTENCGVAGGRNAGLRHVLANQPDYVLFLDNDTLVAPDFLTPLVTRMNADLRIGAVQPKIYFANPPDRICSVGGKLYPRISHYRHPGSGRPDSARFQSATEIDILSGCAALIRARVFGETGLLDETFSPYCHEDIDWSVRLSAAGYRLWFEPAAKVWHRVSSQPQTSAHKLRELSKGHMLFLRLHTKFFDLPASILWIGFHMSRRYLLPALARKDWQSAFAVFAGVWAGARQDRLPIPWAAVNSQPGAQQQSPAISLLQKSPQKKKVLLIGVLGPFDSGPARVYQTLLTSRFMDCFQVRYLDVQFARSVADFERVRPQKFLKLVGYLLRTVFWLTGGDYNALCIHLSTNRNAFLKDSLFAWLGFVFRVPVVVFEHGTNIPALYERGGRTLRWVMRATLRRVARYVVLADCLGFNFKPFVSSDRIVSVHLGISPLSDSAAQSDVRQSDCLRILYLSALLQSKGLLVLLEALPKLLQYRKDVRCIVAGGWGKDSEVVRRRSAEMLSNGHLEEFVSMVGPVEGADKLSLLGSANLFVFPTLADSYGIVLLEAMRAGLPIVATRVGAIPEILIEGTNGLLCEAGNPEDLAEKILFLMERPALRRQMSKNNRERFAKVFTAEKFAGRMIDVFTSVFEESNGRVKHAAAVEI